MYDVELELAAILHHFPDALPLERMWQWRELPYGRCSRCHWPAHTLGPDGHPWHPFCWRNDAPLGEFEQWMRRKVEAGEWRHDNERRRTMTTWTDGQGRFWDDNGHSWDFAKGEPVDEPMPEGARRVDRLVAVAHPPERCAECGVTHRPPLEVLEIKAETDDESERG